MASFGFSTSGNEVVDHFAERVHGKIILITGASANGLGAETALSFARGKPAQLLLLGRSVGKVQPVIDSIATISPETKATFVPVELDKPSSIRAAVEQANSMIPHLDILINNAGIMAVPYSKAEETGVESQLMTNHIGHFLLTKLLMPKLLASSSSTRIVNVSSDGYTISPVHFSDPSFGDGATYRPWTAYGQSKTAQILFTKGLAARFAAAGTGNAALGSEIGVFVLHPGVIVHTGLTKGLDLDTTLADLAVTHRENTGGEFKLSPQKTIQQGCATTLVAALDPRLRGSSGSFLTDCGVVDVQDYAKAEENAEKLWKMSEEMIGEKFEV